MRSAVAPCKLAAGIASALIGAAPTGAAAAVEASSLVRQYDDGRTQVLSPAIDVEASLGRDAMKIGAGYTQDIVTSASADVRTFGSKGQASSITENRAEFKGSVEAAIPDGSIGAAYIQSDEKDYHSRVVQASGQRELFQKNFTLGLAFSNGHDAINSSSNSTFDEAMRHQVYSISASQVLNKKSLVQFLYDLRVESGYLASPYRRAKIDSGDGGAIGSRPENHPRTRNRNAVAFKYNLFFSGPSISTSTAYRFYFDSWDVRSHTVEERISREFGQSLEAALFLRYYAQNSASFYRNYYPSDPGPFYTGNWTLSAHRSWLVGLRPTWKPSDGVSVYLRFEHYALDFEEASDANTLATKSDDVPLAIRAFVYGAGLSARF